MARTKFYVLKMETEVNTETLMLAYHTTGCLIPDYHNCVSYVLKLLRLLQTMDIRPPSMIWEQPAYENVMVVRPVQ